MNNLFRNISLKNKLLTGFGIIVLIMIITGVREFIVINELNSKRIQILKAVNISQQFEELRYIISAKQSELSLINSLEIKKDLKDAANRHFENKNNLQENLLDLEKDINFGKETKNKEFYIQIEDSISNVKNVFENEIIPAFEEVLRMKENIINFQEYFLEESKITDNANLQIDSVVFEQLKNDKKDEIIQTNLAKTQNALRKSNLLIKKLQNTDKISTQIINELEIETQKIFEDRATETLIFVALSIFIFAVVLFTGARIIIRPINRLQKTIDKLTEGSLPETTEVRSADEFGEIEKSINKLIEGLRKTSEFSIEIGKGNFSTDFKVLGKDDVLGNSLLSLRDNLRKAGEEEDKRKKEDAYRNRASEGLALFGDILRRHTENITELSNEIISNLVTFMNANQGGIFILNDEDKTDITLDLLGAYAYNRKKFLSKRIRLGEGLVGAVAIEKYTVYMTDVPNEYIQIESGVGSSNPRSVLIVPLKIDKEILGVLELASFNPFEKYEIELVERIAESIASTLATARINTRTAQLLEQSNFQAEQMKEQEEEMLQNIEELKATQEESNKREKELRKTFTELEKTYKLLENKDEKQRSQITKLQKQHDKHIAEIKKSESLNTTILSTSINGILLLNMDFDIEMFNKSAEKHFGYKEKDVKGKKIYELMSSDLKEEIEKNPENIHKELITTGKESVVIAKDGKEVPVFYSMTAFEYGGETKYSVFFKNISWEKESEKQRMKIIEEVMAKEFEYSVRVEKLEELLDENNIKISEKYFDNELIRWTDKLSIGVNAIDQQHKTWLNIINRFYHSFKTGLAYEELNVIFKELADYTDYHFEFEEKYMEEFGYLLTEEHTKKHKNFLDTIKEFQKDYEEGKVDVAYKLMNFLRKWVRTHVTQDDLGYADLFRKKGLA